MIVPEFSDVLLSYYRSAGPFWSSRLVPFVRCDPDRWHPGADDTQQEHAICCVSYCSAPKRVGEAMKLRHPFESLHVMR